MKNTFLTVLLVFAAGVLSAKEKVIAVWDFSMKNPLVSGSTKLVLRGRSVIEDGMLIASNPDRTRPSGAVIQDRNFRDLSPKGAFSLAVTFMVGQRWTHPFRQGCYLFDTKYMENRDNFHKGFMLYLSTSDGKEFTPCASFGFGNMSAKVTGEKVTLEPEVFHTVELVFNVTGKVSFMMDGKACGGGNIPAGCIVPSDYPPVLGDRRSSSYAPLGGGIRKIVLKELPFETASMVRNLKTRTVFERGEKDQALHFVLTNFLMKPMEDISVNVSVGKQKEFSVKAGTVPAGKQLSVRIPVDTLLLPGTYTMELEVVDGTGKKVVRAESEFTVVPAYGDFMPVVMWGSGDVRSLASIGFTHQGRGIIPVKGKFSGESIPRIVQMLDNNLKGGLYIYTPFNLKYRFLKPQRFIQKARNGKPYQRSGVEASNPAVRSEVAEVVENTAKAVGFHPGWDSVLSNSEVRDHSNPSFTGLEEKAFKKYAGYSIPRDVNSKYPSDYETYPEYPWNRVLPDNDHRLAYYSWFWRKGDGWNDLHTLITETLHKNIKHHFWTFHDPVVRVPAQWGSGGNADVVSQWTYTYPDPIKIGQATDEVIAMAQGRKGQKVMSMTQIIWKRNQTAPINRKVKNPPAWVKAQPDAVYYTIPPDCLREALWSKISRRIDGIMYHGIGSLLPGIVHKSYRFTNDETRLALHEMLQRVVKPLGPALKAIPEREPEVAVLEGFASSLFARQHATFGWSHNWTADLHLALQWAHFQPAVLFEEHLLNDMQGKKLKVLFLPGYEAVTEKVAAKLRELQKQGVLLVGDEFTCPGISPDFRIRSVQRKTVDPAGSKAALQKLGREIADMLQPYYQLTVDASSQDIVIRRRGSDTADYVFLVNDRRTFGDYVGPWGLVMEKGLSLKGTIAVYHPTGAAYDVVNHTPVAFRNENGWTVFSTTLNAGDGALILLTEKPLDGVDMTLPSTTVARGEAYRIGFRVKYTDGETAAAVIPIEIVLTSSDGIRLPGSGFYAARDGSYTLEETAATNMTPGEVRVLVRDLASGKTSEGSFIVR